MKRHFFFFFTSLLWFWYRDKRSFHFIVLYFYFPLTLKLWYLKNLGWEEGSLTTLLCPGPWDFLARGPFSARTWKLGKLGRVGNWPRLRGANSSSNMSLCMRNQVDFTTISLRTLGTSGRGVVSHQASRGHQERRVWIWNQMESASRSQLQHCELAPWANVFLEPQFLHLQKDSKILLPGLLWGEQRSKSARTQ